MRRKCGKLAFLHRDASWIECSNHDNKQFATEQSSLLPRLYSPRDEISNKYNTADMNGTLHSPRRVWRKVRLEIRGSGREGCIVDALPFNEAKVP